MVNNVSASFIIIGDEILSGRTVDKNLNFLAVELSKIGINLAEVRVVPDVEEEIVTAVNELRVKYNYVFTSGGIGPTHDDITTSSIAKAFNVETYRDENAKKILEHHYAKDKLNESRLKMADIPRGASLLNNPVTSAPGFKMENVFVFAGVPKIMQAMFFASLEHLETGDKVTSKFIDCFITEGEVAEFLGNLQKKYQEIKIGSYPYIREGRLGTSFVFRSVNEKDIDESLKELQVFLDSIKS